MTLYRAHYEKKDGSPRTMTFADAYGHKAAWTFAEAWSLGDRLQQVNALTTETMFPEEVKQ